MSIKNDTVQFKTSHEVGIEYVTNVTYGDWSQLFHIYKITTNNCENYFYTSNDINYVGYIENNIFYVVSLKGETFEKEFEDKFSFIDKTCMDSLQNVNSRVYTTYLRKLKNISNFEYVALECVNIINLVHAKNMLLKINKFLNCINYKISINYIFQLKENTEINALEFEIENLLLCVFHNDACISSLIIHYDNIEKEISFDSKTKDEYEGKKLNKLLRAIFIIISKYLYPDAKYVVSTSINPTSAHLMIKYFNATPFDEKHHVIDDKFENYSQVYDYFDVHDSIECKVELTYDNVKNAGKVFQNTCKQIKCEHEEKGGSKRRSHRKIKPKARRTIKKHKKISKK